MSTQWRWVTNAWALTISNQNTKTRTHFKASIRYCSTFSINNTSRRGKELKELMIKIEIDDVTVNILCQLFFLLLFDVRNIWLFRICLMKRRVCLFFLFKSYYEFFFGTSLIRHSLYSQKTMLLGVMCSFKVVGNLTIPLRCFHAFDISDLNIL